MRSSRERQYRHIAARYGVSTGALQRHVREHQPELLAKAHEAEQTAKADRLLTDIRKLQAHTLMMLRDAEKAGDLRTALAAVREARGNVEMLARLRGQLDTRPQVNILLRPRARKSTSYCTPNGSH